MFTGYYIIHRLLLVTTFGQLCIRLWQYITCCIHMRLPCSFTVLPSVLASVITGSCSL